MSFDMRAVVDTNVILSAFLNCNGASNRLQTRAASGAFRMLGTPPLFLEYEEVLKRPEHGLEHRMTLAQIGSVLADLAEIIEPLDVQFLWRPQLRDPDDEMVLEAAINGGADAIVTFNTADFGAAARFGIASGYSG